MTKYIVGDYVDFDIASGLVTGSGFIDKILEVGSDGFDSIYCLDVTKLSGDISMFSGDVLESQIIG